MTAERRSALGLALSDATLADAPAIAAIYAPHVLSGLATFEETPPDTTEIARRLEAVRAAGLPWIIAEYGGRIAGFAYASPYRARSAYRYTVEDSIYVAHEAARSGIGTTLLAELVERCARAGKRQMVAVIGDSANAASIGVHARLGFRMAGVLPGAGYKLGRWVDSVLMTLALGQGDRTPP